MSASPSARAFDALRPSIVERLLELRSSLDPALARSDEGTARAQIESVLDDFSELMAMGDMAAHRAFLTAFVAKRAAEELGPSAALSTLVAIGDTAVQVVQEQVPGTQGDELALIVARITTGSVRIVNDLIAEELIRRRGLALDLRSGRGRIPTDADLRGGPAPAVGAGGAGAPDVPSSVAQAAFGLGRRPGEARQASGELTTHPGTDPSTDPGTDPGARDGSSPGGGASGRGKPARGGKAAAKVRR